MNEKQVILLLRDFIIRAHHHILEKEKEDLEKYNIFFHIAPEDNLVRDFYIQAVRQSLENHDIAVTDPDDYHKSIQVFHDRDEIFNEILINFIIILNYHGFSYEEILLIVKKMSSLYEEENGKNIYE